MMRVQTKDEAATLESNLDGVKNSKDKNIDNLDCNPKEWTTFNQLLAKVGQNLQNLKGPGHKLIEKPNPKPVINLDGKQTLTTKCKKVVLASEITPIVIFFW